MIINQICTVAKVSRYYEKDYNGKKTDKIKGKLPARPAGPGPAVPLEEPI